MHKHHRPRSQCEAGGGRQVAERAQGKLVGREVGCIPLDPSCHVLSHILFEAQYCFVVCSSYPTNGNVGACYASVCAGTGSC